MKTLRFITLGNTHAAIDPSKVYMIMQNTDFHTIIYKEGYETMVCTTVENCFAGNNKILYAKEGVETLIRRWEHCYA